MVRVIWAGRTKDPELAALSRRYEGRIGHYTPFRLDEVPAGRGNRSRQLMEQEGERMLGRISRDATVVALNESGREMTSEGFASWLGRLLSGGADEICFVVGGHLGLSRQVLDRAREQLSLSRMTLTHEMARVLFLEQLYRAFTIMRGEPYHHGNTG